MRRAGYLVKNFTMQNPIVYEYTKTEVTLSYPFEAGKDYIVLARGDGILVKDLDASVSNSSGRVLDKVSVSDAGLYMLGIEKVK